MYLRKQKFFKMAVSALLTGVLMLSLPGAALPAYGAPEDEYPAFSESNLPPCTCASLCTEDNIDRDCHRCVELWQYCAFKESASNTDPEKHLPIVDTFGTPIAEKNFDESGALSFLSVTQDQYSYRDDCKRSVTQTAYNTLELKDGVYLYTQKIVTIITAPDGSSYTYTYTTQSAISPDGSVKNLLWDLPTAEYYSPDTGRIPVFPDPPLKFWEAFYSPATQGDFYKQPQYDGAKLLQIIPDLQSAGKPYFSSYLLNETARNLDKIAQSLADKKITPGSLVNYEHSEADFIDNSKSHYTEKFVPHSFLASM